MVNASILYLFLNINFEILDNHTHIDMLFHKFDEYHQKLTNQFQFDNHNHILEKQHNKLIHRDNFDFVKPFQNILD